jgi:maleylpyruvate isomerase
MADDAEVSGQIAQVDEATQRLLAGLDGLTDADAARPTLCPGWTFGHILTHLARNADALRRCAEGAQRDEVMPMYDSPEARNRDIEAGAGRPMTELIADVVASSQALAQVWPALSPAEWARQMRHATTGLWPVSATRALRLGEVEIHHVDLADRFGPADWPQAFVASLLPEDGELAQRAPDGLALDVRATDTGASWSSGPDGSRRVSVAGPSWAVAAWLVGRPEPARAALSVTGGELPVLKSWP